MTTIRHEKRTKVQTSYLSHSHHWGQEKYNHDKRDNLDYLSLSTMTTTTSIQQQKKYYLFLHVIYKNNHN